MVERWVKECCLQVVSQFILSVSGGRESRLIEEVKQLKHKTDELTEAAKSNSKV